jgi:hypothetical protein
MPAVLPALAALLLASGCGNTVTVSQVVISGIPESDEGPEITAVKVREAVMKDIARADWIGFVPGKKDGATLKIDLTRITEGLGGGTGAWPGERPRIDVSIRSTDEKGRLKSQSVYMEVADLDMMNLRGAKTPEKVLGALVMKALDRLKEREKMAALSGKDLLEELGSKDAWRRELAVEELGSRAEPGSYQQVMQKLKDSDKSVALKAVGALVTIGNKAAVPSIIDFARGKELPIQVQMIYAIAQIGGPVAEGYLFVVSTGCPDPQVASAAKEALDELEAKARRRHGAAVR